MPVLGLLSFALEVPSVDEGVRFYTDAGLEVSERAAHVTLRCPGQRRHSIRLIGGATRKRFHHATLRADALDLIAADVPAAGGRIIPAPSGFEADGLWVEDPHGVIYHLVECQADPTPDEGPAFEINAPGRITRKRRSAVLPSSHYATVAPIKLGHIMLFTPDVMASVRFVTDALGMGLADHVLDHVAFTCARRDSDHHVLAFGKSNGIGLHHASFQVRDPDEVGRAGNALRTKAGRGDWGFGRHTIGSNFFHYIQDPWGSWFEYYADMDYIDDYARWTPTDYAPEDGLASWAPELPPDFVRNCEAEGGTA